MEERYNQIFGGLVLFSTFFASIQLPWPLSALQHCASKLGTGASDGLEYFLYMHYSFHYGN